MPRRTVAVKVLLPGAVNTDVQQMFLSETTLMAQLSAHPSVLTVYEASISADGRPYLVMEFCPASYGARFRKEVIPVTEVLQVALAIGGVLETAHRDGVLHRDIKPANILVTRYGKPVLADFGIAATIAKSESLDAIGMSIPWSAPEVLDEHTRGNIRSEVWGFVATIYTLLAGRSPFEVPDKDNGRHDVYRRIAGRDVVKPTGRPDVPPSLERILAQGLSKDPAKRQGTILEVLRSIQLVETEMGMRPTPLDIANESVIDVSRLPSPSTESTSTTIGRSSGRRRLRTSAASTAGTAGSLSPSASRSASRGAEATMFKAWSNEPDTALRKRRMLLWTIIGGGVAVLAAATVVVVSLLSQAGSGIPRVSDISASTSGDSIEFSWDDPGITEGDNYLVRVDNGTGVTQRSTSFVVDTSQSTGRVCVTVTVVRNGQNGEVSEAKCAEG